MVKAVLGSKNPSKLNALKDVLKDYEIFKDAQVQGIEVETNVSEQPLTLNETIQGAKNRAKNAYNKIPCNYSFGIESGFMEIPNKSGYLEFTVCAIYQGYDDYHIGFSPGFECPQDIMNLIINEGLDLSQASFKAGYTNDEDLGKKSGISGVLTNGRIDRTSYTVSAIIMAMIHVEKNTQ